MLSSLVSLNPKTQAAFDKLADRIIAKAQPKPYFPLPNYQDRWWLVRPTTFLGFTISIRVHHILRSDNDRDLHDHPLPSISWILKKGYRERTPWKQSQPAFLDSQGLTRTKTRLPGDLVIRWNASDRHALEIIDGDCWSVFIFFGRTKHPWGFHTPHGWVWWRIYCGDWNDLTQSEIDRAMTRDPSIRRSIPTSALAALA